MDRAQLEKLSTAQLKREAVRCQLPVEDRSMIIEALLGYHERASRIEWLESPQEAATGEQSGPGGPERSGEDASDGDRPVTMGGGAPRDDEWLHVVSPAKPEHVHENANRAHAENDGDGAEKRSSVGGANGRTYQRSLTRVDRQNPLGIVVGHRRNGSLQRNGFPTGNAVQWIASQIPEFGGTQADNVLSWVKRVEKVAQVHGASDGVTLLAASSRLTKSA